MPYLDGYVIPVPRKEIAAYKRMARKCVPIFKDHGAIEFRECAGDDLRTKMGTPFTKLSRLKRGETVMFSYVVYKSRAARDRALARIMKDPRMEAMMKSRKMPFDVKRMACGGFRVIVDA